MLPAVVATEGDQWIRVAGRTGSPETETATRRVYHPECWAFSLVVDPHIARRVDEDLRRQSEGRFRWPDSRPNLSQPRRKVARAYIARTDLFADLGRDHLARAGGKRGAVSELRAAAAGILPGGLCPRPQGIFKANDVRCKAIEEVVDEVVAQFESRAKAKP